MSIRPYKAPNLPNGGIVEQVGERNWSLGNAIGRTDSLDTTFVCRTVDANPLVATKFAPYAPHPTLDGFVCLPDSVRWAEKWTGLSIISASYIGSRIFPKLPDGHFIGTEPGEQVFPGLVASAETVAQYGSAVIPEARMVYSIYYVEHVHYGTKVPEVQKNVGCVYRISDLFLPSASAVLCLEFSEILESQGTYHHIRDRYVPIIAAVNQRVYSAYNDSVSSAGKLDGIDFQKMGVSVTTDLDITIAEIAMFVSDKLDRKLSYVAETTDLNLTRCSITDSVFKRQSKK